MSVGERLRGLRTKAKRTLKEQSESFGVSVNTIYRWEHGLASPREQALRRMADHYEVTYEWLLDGNDGAAAGYAEIVQPDLCIETQLLRMFRKLSSNSKYRILGYVERVYVEEMEKLSQAACAADQK